MSITAKEHKEKAQDKINFAVITISTSRFEKISKKESFSNEAFDILRNLLSKSGFSILFEKIIPDNSKMIKETIYEILKKPDIDIIITMGGTGIAPSDLTIETITPILEKELQGFGEIFRMLSYNEIGSPALLTRAKAGILKYKPIFCLPGSPQAVEMALKKMIIPEAGHILKHIKEK